MKYPNTEGLTNKIMIEFSKTIEMFGLTTLEARLFAYLYLSNKSLTLDDMSDGLGKSKTSMSTSIRSLSELNLVTRVWKKGIRKDLYRANTQLFKTFMNAYINKWIDATNRQKSSLEDINNSIKQKNNNRESDEEIIGMDQQLDDMIEFHKQVEALFREMKQD